MNILRQIQVQAPKWYVKGMLQKSVFWPEPAEVGEFTSYCWPSARRLQLVTRNGLDRMAAGEIPSSLQRQQLELGIKHEANQAYHKHFR
ncbi:hypothetical protein GQ55_6G196200 [Panicum hallii var. hallii]|uniref:Uncharacterized protein n=1 Tax=Panicum hallii var. hallii TaxID=1504633 RepID=A0A2T7D7I7_9POAL|nr:hypothetical protein GQ55_6G196200 [Panicum hallii var. hallii]